MHEVRVSNDKRFELIANGPAGERYLKDDETGAVYGRPGEELLRLVNGLNDRIVKLTSNARPPLANDPEEDLPVGSAVSNPLSSVSCTPHESLFAIDWRGRLWFTKNPHTSNPDWRRLEGPRG
jgi:hypothetical protein